MQVCADCAAYGMYPEADVDIDVEHLEVNLANTNARMILHILGLDAEDLSGCAPAEQFLGAVLLALAEDRDHRCVPAVEMPRACDDTGREVGARWIDCGLRPGYVAETLANLHALALEAARLGRDVYWA